MHSQGACDSSAQKPGEWADSIEFYIPTFNSSARERNSLCRNKSYSVHDNMTTDGERSYESHRRIPFIKPFYSIDVYSDAL